MRNQILSQNLLPTIPTLYRSLDDAIQSDIGLLRTLQLARFVLALDETSIHGFVLAPPTLLTPGWRSGMSIFVPNWPAIREAAQDLFNTDPFLATNTPTYCP